MTFHIPPRVSVETQDAASSVLLSLACICLSKQGRIRDPHVTGPFLRGQRLWPSLCGHLGHCRPAPPGHPCSKLPVRSQPCTLSHFVLRLFPLLLSTVLAPEKRPAWKLHPPFCFQKTHHDIYPHGHREGADHSGLPNLGSRYLAFLKDVLWGTGRGKAGAVGKGVTRGSPRLPAV